MRAWDSGRRPAPLRLADPQSPMPRAHWYAAATMSDDATDPATNPGAHPGANPGANPGARRDGGVYLSVVAPAHNEEDNVGPLVEEIVAAIGPVAAAGGWAYEVVIVNDGSTDATGQRLAELRGRFDVLRVIETADTPAGKGNGQSAAFHAAFRAARGELIAVLDADLQNDPADLPAMLEQMARDGADMVQGDRSRNRKDTFKKRVTSIVGRQFRLWLLGDTIRDTGCSLRVMRRELALRLPLEFMGAHRFIPITARQMGYTVVEAPVHHRARVAGVPKYGTWDRAKVGLFDCFAVNWMGKRRRPVGFREVNGGTG